MKRYLVTTWSDDIGSDSHMDFNHFSDAVEDARKYKGREEYGAIYDSETKTAYVIFGDPDTPVFSSFVTVIG